jgi:uncharacterized protein YkwD/LysM repeat protein
MSRRASSLLALLVFIAFGSTSLVHAESAQEPLQASSPYDLVNAVNALRASFGLSLYSINPILMATAQAQADFLASTGNMTHSGPGGIGFTERLLAAGYPLAGDLSLGGFRAENITGGPESMPAEAAVDRWTGDALHLNTMISQNLTEIGAGVAVSNGRVYYVIDCARPISAGDPPQFATLAAGGSIASEVPAVIIPVSVSTPNLEGNVIHEVKPGQTLWQIAITYEVKIDDIKRLNNLLDNNIYPGNKLLIKTGVLVPTSSPTEASTQIAISTSLSTLTSTPRNGTKTPTPIMDVSSARASNTRIMKIAIGIIALVLLGGGIFTWLGSSKKE